MCTFTCENRDNKIQTSIMSDDASTVGKKVNRCESCKRVVTTILKSKAVKVIFKGTVLLVFFCAFLYQVIIFLEYVFEYPTTLSMDIVAPAKYLAPAFTFCSSIRISRKKVCDAYPDCCIPTDKDFCEKYRAYCETADIRVTDECLSKIRNLDRNASAEFELELSDIYHGFLGKHIRRGSPFAKLEPLKRRLSEKIHLICFSYGSVVISKVEPIYENNSRKEVNYKYDLAYFNAPEMFDPEILPGIYFAAHSQFDTTNPAEDGHFLKPNKQYKIFIAMKEEKRLPFPYKTNCIDYSKLWRDSGKKGPRSQKMCKWKCERDELFLSTLNCSEFGGMYPSEETRICTDKERTEYDRIMMFANFDYLSLRIKRYNRCTADCTQNCELFSYASTIKEDPENAMRGKSSLIRTTIFVNTEEVSVYEFSPKFQKVEIFSFIGGFLGIWLGISLVQVADFLKYLFILFWKFYEKKKSLQILV